MPISPVVADTVQMRLLWSIGGELAINVLNFRAAPSVVVNQAFANTVGASIKASYQAQWAAQCPPTSQLVSVGVRDLRTPNQLEFKDTSPISSGIATGDAMPASNAVVVTLRTAKSGKSFRGRVYLPGAGETANSANGVQSTALTTSGVAFVNDIATRMQAQNLTLAVMSRPAEAFKVVKTTTHADGTTTVKTLSNVTAKSGGIENMILAESRNARWEVQRRRQNGRSTTALLELVAAQQAAISRAAQA